MLILCGSNRMVNMNGGVMYLNLTCVIQVVVNAHMYPGGCYHIGLTLSCGYVMWGVW